MKKTIIIILLCLVACGCSRHAVKHSIKPVHINWDREHILAIKDFKDMRPEEEKTGKTSKFLKFASKDSHFEKPVIEILDTIFKDEFSKTGLHVKDFNYQVKDDCHYTLSGTVLHLHAALQLPKTTVVPYLKHVASIWTKDEFIIAIEIEAKLTDNRTGKTLLDKTYVFSEDKKLPSGLFNLARYSRGFNYKLKLLDVALSDVLEDIRDDVLKTIKNI